MFTLPGVVLISVSSPFYHGHRAYFHLSPLFRSRDPSHPFRTFFSVYADFALLISLCFLSFWRGGLPRYRIFSFSPPRLRVMAIFFGCFVLSLATRFFRMMCVFDILLLSDFDGWLPLPFSDKFPSFSTFQKSLLTMIPPSYRKLTVFYIYSLLLICAVMSTSSFLLLYRTFLQFPLVRHPGRRPFFRPSLPSTLLSQFFVFEERQAVITLLFPACRVRF